MSIFFMVYLTLLRRVYAIREKLQNKVAPKIHELFEKILFEDYLDTEDEIRKEFEKTVNKNNRRRRKGFGKKKQVSNSYEMDLAIDTLIRIRNNSHEESTRYPMIFNALQIEKYLGSKFSFTSSGTKKKAISYFSELGMANSDSTILTYTYSNNEEVQTEARLSYLNLSKNDPYRFFDELKGDMTKWSQVKLMNLLIEQSNTVGLPNFGKWIGYSTNDSLVIFLLKAAAYFNQKKAIEIIRSKVKDVNHELRAEAILALGKLGDVEYEEVLTRIYFNEPDICQEAIIRCVGFLATGKSLEFLKLAFQDSKDLDAQKNIALVMYDYGPEGKAMFAELKSEMEKQLEEAKNDDELVDVELFYRDLLFKHAENDLILYK
ncbi:HEAT repeat domain-containing protein [Wenyingzhuangia sp. 2_MG-2023]|uniref:HEAT repeat domain-containing protein n=1 Tax=Wenyingzhuangia sp. 2_MG-2023 TaxID=3062639 RepID=UPI0026E43B6B|nr:HEAT repeat domain-containing protein [Wenyingzhuangia sp. 2_MG-2023]MDO6739376.1 HEAT repeat domain-containing protein [Wenyingzhuangia sp. 2_MG-2023]